MSGTQGSAALPVAQVRKLSLSIFLQDEIAGNPGDFYIARQERTIGRVLGLGDGKLLWQHFMQNGENGNCLVLLQLESGSIGI